MLVLNKKPQERIIIGQTIKMVLLEVRGNRVRRSIDPARGTGARRDSSQTGGKDTAVRKCDYWAFLHSY